ENNRISDKKFLAWRFVMAFSTVSVADDNLFAANSICSSRERSLQPFCLGHGQSLENLQPPKISPRVGREQPLLRRQRLLPAGPGGAPGAAGAGGAGP
ncbi:unnamed protein product, partial [Heterosigma akashiwo]